MAVYLDLHHIISREFDQFGFSIVFYPDFCVPQSASIHLEMPLSPKVLQIDCRKKRTNVHDEFLSE